MSSSPFFSEHLAARILSSKHRLNIASPMPPTRYFCSHSSQARRLISAQRSCEAKARGAWMASSNTRPLHPSAPCSQRGQTCCGTPTAHLPPPAAPLGFGVFAAATPAPRVPPRGRQQARGTNLILLMQGRNCPDNLSDTKSDMELQPGSCRELHKATTEPKPPPGRGAAGELLLQTASWTQDEGISYSTWRKRGELRTSMQQAA